MTALNTTDIRQQLRQELVSEDPSLVVHKETYLTLFDRMIASKPEIEMDDVFQSQLKDRLRYHLITQYEPAPEINRWQTLLVYGVPSLVILSVVLVYLPQRESSEPLAASTMMMQSSEEMQPEMMRMIDAPVQDSVVYPGWSIDYEIDGDIMTGSISTVDHPQYNFEAYRADPETPLLDYSIHIDELFAVDVVSDEYPDLLLWIILND